VNESMASFKIAAKHLFRHLHAPSALRHNPLVARFFDKDGLRDVEAIKKERRALDYIHSLVRQAADYYREEDIAKDKIVRARRRHTIVMSQCAAEVDRLLSL
jgi:hypothetical protein